MKIKYVLIVGLILISFLISGCAEDSILCEAFIIDNNLWNKSPDFVRFTYEEGFCCYESMFIYPPTQECFRYGVKEDE